MQKAPVFHCAEHRGQMPYDCRMVQCNAAPLRLNKYYLNTVYLSSAVWIKQQPFRCSFRWTCSS